jgi:hypothetical protein
MKKILFEGNGLTLIEKETKKGNTLIFKYGEHSDTLDLEVVSPTEINLIIVGFKAGTFGFTGSEISEKNLNFKKHKIIKKKKSIQLFIPKNK